MRYFVGQAVGYALGKIRGGEGVKDIVCYWFPELISGMILIILPSVFDSYLVANSQTLTSYGALALTTNFLHLFTKMAEAIPVASVAFIGRYNGAGEYKKCGESLSSSFWVTFSLGIMQFVFLSAFAADIYRWLGASEPMVAIGAPFLRLKSLGIILIFTLFSFIFFLRGIKNTRIPMIINIIGMTCFLFCDYALVLGRFGFPKMGLYGSAVATIVQYTVMNGIAISYILLNTSYKKYFTKIFFTSFSPKKAFSILSLSWPIIIDKSSFAMSYVWLSAKIAPLGDCAIATYDVVKNLERTAFLPAIAFAQVITFLVSNRLGCQDYQGASNTIKKVLLLTTFTVGITLTILCFNAAFFVGLFDKTGEFTDTAATTLIIISLFVVFDLVQIILAGALRGAGDVKAVMFGRFLPCAFFFVPLSSFFSTLPIENKTTKFILIYSSYYMTMGVMSLIFLLRIKSHKWQKNKI